MDGSKTHTLKDQFNNNVTGTVTVNTPSVKYFKVAGLTGIYANPPSWWSVYYIHDSSSNPVFGQGIVNTYVVPVSNISGIGFKMNGANGEIYGGSLGDTDIPITNADVTAAGTNPLVYITLYYFV
jgi:hypothetical protein